MATVRAPARALFTLGAAVFVLSGCNKVTGGGDDASADFARAALERNDGITVVAFDKKENTFTIRMKDTGELRVVHADQVVGGIPGATGSEGKTQPVSDETPASGETTASTPSATPGQTASSDELARPETTAAQPAPTSGRGVITDPRTGNVLASAGDASSAEPGQEAASGPSAASTNASSKKVLASGPGYSITAGDRAPASTVRLASRSSDIPSPARGVAVERRSEPLICQGQRLMHLDGRNLEFDGDALSVEDGCEIHITNSHIIAHGGIGLSARAANVHIKNSVIEGDSGSVSASGGSQVYTQQSTFKGLSRRLDTATFHDLGGTVWNN
jgi:hypothetical protein